MSSSSTSDLKVWTRDRLASLFTNTGASATNTSISGDHAVANNDLDSAFESTFAPEGKVNIIVNGEEVERGKYKEGLKAQMAAATKVDVGFGELSEETPSADVAKEGAESTVVKGIWTVTRSLKFRIRAAPAKMERISHFQANVQPVEISPDSTPEYRIVCFEETVENKHAPIVLHPAVRAQAGEPHDEA